MVFKGFLTGNRRQSIYLGAPEAEAETSSQSRVNLMDVYEDYHNLMEQLSYEKFIIIGRKGSGKSAFAEYVYLLAQENPNLFCEFIRKDKVSLEHLVQLGDEAGYTIKGEQLFKWLIYTNIIKLFAFNEAAMESKEYELLRQFVKKNSGFIDIDKNQVNELVRKHGFEVNVEPLRRFIKSKLSGLFEFKESRAPFYKLLPHLEEVIVKVLKSRVEKDNTNSYAIFFDDLDIGFNINNQETVDNVVELIRTCKSINNEIFGKNNIQAKAYVLIRDDFEKFISSKYADTAKIFSSYSAFIRWYQDEVYRNGEESDLNIKKFINKRIRNALENQAIVCNEEDPWYCLVDKTNDNTNKSSFKHLLDHTLYRPRDLLLMFSPLENGTYPLPLGRNELKSLIEQYSENLVKELKNELSSFYTESEIEQLFVALAEISKESGFGDDAGLDYERAKEIIQDCIKTDNPSKILDDLFDRSMIGAKEPSGPYKYKCREPIGSAAQYRLRYQDKILLQYAIRDYVSGRRYA
ncbi:P-loop ATPase, Sll1717 family [Marinobacterium sediminicola]|uniref:DNA phosphorothioation-dependent restriction protein DptF n=1 Tax=Marinobacterium sediminicola TaxID=518898 RepID=A0ABY1RWH2_9GAMM|nr:hypothetical protein [Marinobacterium sediminicola]ULG70315.1 hypothetical protein LN244_05745 [Marinobacterium sediminicola]SMR69746.1 hypothetical protein SAMN04487964_101349 [Marinobacterium sediminicola]